MSLPRRHVADYFYPELTAIAVAPRGGVCSSEVTGFSDRQVQQAVFDGENDDPGLLANARATCAACPALAACRQFAEVSLDDTTFLAGTTAEERSRAARRAPRTRHRRAVVERMRKAGVTIPDITFYTGYPTRSVEADLARSERDKTARIA
ncbi:hypothetical protein CFP71_27060 [Amycolatopsis thailandensis]|uniref:4Fe-4S Wbl-type domain-containing protein n=1 Tax=Amycolatopsis thailandensis TaxID=589330 RepID=A0A229RVC4_9PSEU|nr:hypothetical protein [Amycolatopsis thailandensis]OXM50612.1 hypothetical protein CFP71_27060 [Amycolatopsis thailandensis]